jgi:cell volume regulation protein A
VALVLLTYSVAAAAGGNGFLAVYLAAMVLGNSNLLHKRSLMRFHDGLAWLMQIAMFLTLGLQVFPSRPPSTTLPSLAVASFLMFLARPGGRAPFAVGQFPQLARAHPCVMGWAARRGSHRLGNVSVAGWYRQGRLNVRCSVLHRLDFRPDAGTSIGWLSTRLGLAQRSKHIHRDPLDLVSNGERDIVEFPIHTDFPVAGKRIVDLELPPSTLVLLVERSGVHIIPRGGKTIQPGDHLLVLAAKDQMPAVRRTLP